MTGIYFFLAISLFAVAVVLLVSKSHSVKTSFCLPEVAECSWPEGFIRSREDYVHERFLNDSSCPAEASEIMDVLMKHGVAYDKVCAAEGFEAWFDNHLQLFCSHLAFLSYISRHSDLCIAFIKSLENGNAQNDLLLQKNLVSVWHHEVSDAYRLNCHYLLWYYLDKWDLADEIKKTIATDERFADVLIMYKQKRGDL